MKEDWKRFYLPFIGLLIVLSVLTYISYCYYGFSFWETFYAHFMATVFGVTFSVIVAFVIWRYQQRTLKAHKRKQLFDDLEIELRENLERLVQIENELNKYEEKNQHMVSVSMSMRGFNVAGIDIQFLRTVAMTEFLKPENRLLVKDVQFEDDIGWVFWRCNLFNEILSIALKEFEGELNSDITREEAFPKFKSTVLQGFHFLLGFMHSLDRNLGGDFFYSKNP